MIGRIQLISIKLLQGDAGKMNMFIFFRIGADAILSGLEAVLRQNTRHSKASIANAALDQFNVK